jgi:hypothetical protein
VCDPDQPTRRPGGEPREKLCDVRPQWIDDGGADAEHRRGWYRGGGEEVGWDGDDAHAAGECRNDGRTGQLGGRRHREGFGHARRHSAISQRVPPPWCEQHQTARGQHRQREACVGGERGIEQQATDNRRRECGRGCLAPPRDEGQQPHRAHGRRTNDAWRRTGQDDKPGEGGRAQHRTEPWPGAAPTDGEEHHTEDDRQVRTTYGDQMSHTGGPEVLCQRGVEAARVPNDQAG